MEMNITKNQQMIDMTLCHVSFSGFFTVTLRISIMKFVNQLYFYLTVSCEATLATVISQTEATGVRVSSQTSIPSQKDKIKGSMGRCHFSIQRNDRGIY